MEVLSKDHKLCISCMILMGGIVLFLAFGVPWMRTRSFHRFLQLPAGRCIAESLRESGVRPARPRHQEAEYFGSDRHVLLRFEVSEQEWARFISVGRFTPSSRGFLRYQESEVSWWHPSPDHSTIYSGCGFEVAYDHVEHVAYFVTFNHE